MTDDLELFDVPDTFEGMSQQNGEEFWWQSDLQRILGYKEAKSFNNAIGRAIQALNAIGAPVQENFRHSDREIDGQTSADCKLSRFACYMVAINADPKKPEVARAQAYFATWAEVARRFIEGTEEMERILARDEVSVQEKALSHTAQAAGVTHFPFFHSAGYRGLYNMTLSQVKSRKGLPEKCTILDFMGREELAANLFRITQTEARIRDQGIRGQAAAEDTAFRVGGQVRKAIQDIGGKMPENLAPAKDIKEVKKDLRGAQKEIRHVHPQRQLPPCADEDLEV